METLLEPVFKRCPVCGKGEIREVEKKTWELVLGRKTKVRCNACNAEFSCEGVVTKGGLTIHQESYKLLPSGATKNHKYVGQILRKSEWERGASDLDYCIQTNTLPDVEIKDTGLLLEEGEKVHHGSTAEFFEERAVRRSMRGFGAVRIAKGVYIGGGPGVARSYPELRKIDIGALLLTNKRLVFNGGLKHIEYGLNKISSLQEYKDAIEVGAANRTKVQVFKLKEPHVWMVYIKIATSKYAK